MAGRRFYGHASVLQHPSQAPLFGQPLASEVHPPFAAPPKHRYGAALPQLSEEH